MRATPRPPSVLCGLMALSLCSLQGGSTSPESKPGYMRTAEHRYGQSATPGLYKQGYQALTKGDLAAAERLWQAGREQAGAAADRQEEARCVFGLGYLASLLHTFDRAVVCYGEALSLWKQVGDRKQMAATEEDLALTYGLLGQSDLAWEYLNAALSLRRALQDANYVAIDLYRIGAIYDDLGQPEKAIESWRLAQQHRWKNDDQTLNGQCLNNLGLVYRKTNRLTEALDVLQRAAAIRRKIGSPDDLSDTLNNLGAVYDDLGREAEAEECYRQALKLFEDSGQAVDVASGSSSLARDVGSLYLRLGQEEKAEKAFQQALQQEETLRAQLADPGEITDLQASLPNAYAGLAALRLRQKRASEALELVERGRVQGLARQAAQCHAEFTGLLPTADRARLQTARQAMTEADRQRRIAARLPASPDADRQRTQTLDRARQAKAALAQFQAELCRRFPDYGRLQGADPPSPARLQALADRNPDALYLEFVVVDARSTLLFALSHAHGLQAYTLPIGSRALSRQIGHWHEALIAPAETRLDRKAGAQRLAASEPTEARALARLLFAPLERAGQMPTGGKTSARHLVIVADGLLAGIPFPALIDASGHRLIDHAAVSTSPSLGMLDWPLASFAPSPQLLCIADPTGAGGQALQRGGRGGFGALPYARKEGEAVARLFPHTLALFGAEAHKARVEQEIGKFALLHFATHSVLDTRVGLRSGLALAPETPGSTEATILEAREILGLKLSARLAVLSACESGLGQRTGGEGLKGLCWAFRAAGCPSIVASLWKVDDIATRDLMIAFYKNLKAGKRKDDALREAMLTGAAAPNRTHPYYWAAFQVMGDALPLPASL